MSALLDRVVFVPSLHFRTHCTDRTSGASFFLMLHASCSQVVQVYVQNSPCFRSGSFASMHRSSFWSHCFSPSWIALNNFARSAFDFINSSTFLNCLQPHVRHFRLALRRLGRQTPPPCDVRISDTPLRSSLNLLHVKRSVI